MCDRMIQSMSERCYSKSVPKIPLRFKEIPLNFLASCYLKRFKSEWIWEGRRVEMTERTVNDLILKVLQKVAYRLLLTHVRRIFPSNVYACMNREMNRSITLIPKHAQLDVILVWIGTTKTPYWPLLELNERFL